MTLVTIRPTLCDARPPPPLARRFWSSVLNSTCVTRLLVVTLLALFAVSIHLHVCNDEFQFSSLWHSSDTPRVNKGIRIHVVVRMRRRYTRQNCSCWDMSNAQDETNRYSLPYYPVTTLVLWSRMPRSSGDHPGDAPSLDIDLSIPAVAFAVLYTIMLLYYTRKVLRNPTFIFTILSLFCASELGNTPGLSESAGILIARRWPGWLLLRYTR